MQTAMAYLLVFFLIIQCFGSSFGWAERLDENEQFLDPRTYVAGLLMSKKDQVRRVKTGICKANSDELFPSPNLWIDRTLSINSVTAHEQTREILTSEPDVSPQSGKDRDFVTLVHDLDKKCTTADGPVTIMEENTMGYREESDEEFQKLLFLANSMCSAGTSTTTIRWTDSPQLGAPFAQQTTAPS